MSAVVLPEVPVVDTSGWAELVGKAGPEVQAIVAELARTVTDLMQLLERMHETSVLLRDENDRLRLAGSGVAGSA